MSYPPTQGPYRNIPQAGDPRQTEAWALTEAARRMSEAQRDGAGADDILAAVRLNWRLWTIFQAELTNPSNELPLELRQNMLSLCNFVDKTTVDIIAEPQGAKLGILITVNRNIASGLFSIPAGQAEAPAEAQDQPQGGVADLSA